MTECSVNNTVACSLFLRYYVYYENTFTTSYNPAFRKSIWFSFTLFWWSTLVSRSDLCYTMMDKHKSQPTTRRRDEDCSAQITHLNTVPKSQFIHTKCWLRRQFLRKSNPVIIKALSSWSSLSVLGIKWKVYTTRRNQIIKKEVILNMNHSNNVLEETLTGD